ncbi:MAG TPA: ribonuclease P protein component [Sphingobacteriaceae bacterium]
MYTFKKEERLCSKKLLEKLFHNGSSFLLYPFRISWLIADEIPDNVPAQVVISVSKRRFKRAVDRNTLKRRMREIYRLNKTELVYSYLEKPILLSISYVGNEVADFPFMEKKLKQALFKLKNQYMERYADQVD